MMAKPMKTLELHYLMIQFLIITVRLLSLFLDLTGENRSMKNYIDRLMIVLMDKFPEVLENCGSSA